MERQKFAIGDALSWGFKTWVNQIMFFLVVGLVFFGIYIAVVGISILLMSFVAQRMAEDNPLIVICIGIVCLALGLFFVWLFLGLMKIMLNVYDYGKADIKTLFSQGHLIVPFFGASFLYTLLIALGTAFFVIPGIYFLCRYFFFSYALVDKNLGILESFQESSRLTQGVRWQVLGLVIMSWLINIVPMLMFVTMLAAIYAYRQQQENTLQLPIVSK